jgi:hypothetical protein
MAQQCLKGTGHAGASLQLLARQVLDVQLLTLNPEPLDPELLTLPDGNPAVDIQEGDVLPHQHPAATVTTHLLA